MHPQFYESWCVGRFFKEEHFDALVHIKSSAFLFSFMQMPRGSLAHPPFWAFFYVTVLFPSSHYSIIYILSLICANVVITCKGHTKTGCYCCLSVSEEPTLRAVIGSIFGNFGKGISLQESSLVTASQVPKPKTCLQHGLLLVPLFSSYLSIPRR